MSVGLSCSVGYIGGGTTALRLKTDCVVTMYRLEEAWLHLYWEEPHRSDRAMPHSIQI